MPGPLESSLETFFAKEVRKYGGYTIKLAPTERGIPDRLVMFHGQMYLVELKTEDGSLSPIQSYWHAKILDWTEVPVVTLYGGASMRRWVRRTFGVDVAEPVEVKTQALTCGVCGGGWTRPLKPGRHPASCPSCRKVVGPVSAAVG